MQTLGVDPGKNGAAALIRNGQLIDVRSFAGGLDNCRSIMMMLDPFDLCDVFIERVTASPQMGVVSAFTFGRYAEAVETAVVLAKRIPVLVQPKKWQLSLGVVSAGNKDVLYKEAIRLFPEEHKVKMFNKNSADAVLIAWYGWHRFLNT